MKLFRMLGRSIRDAVKSVIRNFSLSLASISCITITLIIVAIAIMASYNVQNFTKEIERDMTIVAFLDNDATKSDVKEIEKEINSISNVDKYTYQSKQEVKEKMQAESDVFDTVLQNWSDEESPLKDTIQVKVKDVEKINKTAAKIESIDKVAVVRSDSGGLVDSDNILTIDLSTMDRIKDKPYLCNQIDVRFEKVMDLIEDLCRIDPSLTMKFKRCAINETDKNARGFKYANNSNEVCVFKYVPKDYIVAILEALQIDLIRTNAFSTEFLKLSKEDQKKELDILKKSIEYSLINYHDPFLMHVFYELYINNKSINRIVTVQDSEEKIKRARNKVLEIARHTPNIQIKR